MAASPSSPSRRQPGARSARRADNLPHGVGLRTYMLAAIIILGTVVAVIVIALLLNLD